MIQKEGGDAGQLALHAVRTACMYRVGPNGELEMTGNPHKGNDAAFFPQVPSRPNRSDRGSAGGNGGALQGVERDCAGKWCQCN